MPGIDELSGNLLARLADGSVRAVLLALIAVAALKAARVKRPAAQHAVWVVVAACMLIAPFVRIPAPRWTMPLTEPTLVLSGAPAPAAERVADGRRVVVAAPLPRPARWPRWVAVLYLAGILGMALRLMVGYRTTCRLRDAGLEVRDPELRLAWERACARMSLAWPLPTVLVSEAVTVPMIVGTRDVALLLPPDWRTWDAGTLRSVLLHEAAHCRRRDGAASLLAAINCCAYWFHPLAWWIARRLPALAEHAADDAALSSGADTREYAAAVLEFAKAASGGRRVLLGSSAMARTGNVSRRIERILEGPRSFGFASRRTWMAVMSLAIPLVCATAALQVVASPQAQVSTPFPGPERLNLLRAGYDMTAEQAAEAEARLVTDPQDLIREQLVAYYFAKSMPERRIEHLFWLIQNHPESWIWMAQPARISPTPTLNSIADYERAKALWLEQASKHASNAMVLSNAAMFLGDSDLPTTLRFLQQARRLDPESEHTAAVLARVCGRILSEEIDMLARVNSSASSIDPAFRASVQAELESSTDAKVVGGTGQWLSGTVSRPLSAAGEAPSSIWELTQRRHELAQRLLERAILLEPEKLRWKEALERLRNPPPPPGALPGGPSRIRVGSGVQQAMLVSATTPPYPPLARQARIQGVVQLDVLIGKDGKVINATVGSGHPLLVPAALEAVKAWRYQPTLLNGQPMEVATQVEVPFTLKPGE